MEQSEKVESLRLSFLKLQTLGIFESTDQFKTVEELLKKLYQRREEIERQYSRCENSHLKENKMSYTRDSIGYHNSLTK